MSIERFIFNNNNDDGYVITVTWRRIIRPEGSFVYEDSCAGRVEYGPMPELTMAPFIAERKAFFEGVFGRQRSSLVA